MSRTSLTNEKKSFYKFKNKVDLTNKETFGYFSNVNPFNNELFVYLNNSLDNSASKAITNHNLGYNINDVVKLFWDDKVNTANVNKFYDESLFGTLGSQPQLTEFMEYRGNIFELYERLTQYTKDKVSREQDVKSKYLDWFDPNFITTVAMERIAKYIFNMNSFSNRAVDGIRSIKAGDLTYKFNEYFRLEANSAALNNNDMYVMANSNSIRPSRIYYKKVATEKAVGVFEYKFIFPLYIQNNMSSLASIVGLTVLRSVTPLAPVRQSTNYQT